MRALPERTAQLFERIKLLQPIGEFILIGGTALALRLGHRMSEALDFIAAKRIPRGSVERILEALYAQGSKITRLADMGKMLEFDLAGEDVRDYSQRWRVDGVKLDFLAKSIMRNGERIDVATTIRVDSTEADTGFVRVASEDSLFRLKSQLIEERLTVRDLFDLRVLLSRNQRTVQDLLDAAEGLGASADAVKLKIVRGSQTPQDPPVSALIDVPTRFEALRAWLVEAIDRHEQALAERSARGHKTPE